MTARSFGPFVLDRERGVVLRDSRPLPLGQRAISVLCVLADNAGQAVSKADLMAQVWPDTIVEEGNLTVQIAALRKALGETADGQSWILTVPRLGYRLLGDRASGVSERTAALPSHPQLAVLPFEVLSGDESGSWFAEGVVQDIVAALSRFRSFAVVGVSAASGRQGVEAQEAAARHGVRYLLTGSLRRAGDRLRITAQLVDDATGASLWAERFDGAPCDVFAFQDRITATVAQLVEPHVQAAEIARSWRERPGSLATYDIYLRALAKIAAEAESDNAEAFELLIKGLAIEPDNPLLLSHAAWALEHRSTMGWPPIGPDDRERCAEFARRGLEHADGDAMVVGHCGMSLLQGAREYDLGMATLLAAVEANPNHLMSVFEAGVAHLLRGSLDEALGLFQRADHLSLGDPRMHFALCGRADAHLILGDAEEALAWATRAYAASPNYDPTLWILIAANAHLGRMAEAQRALGEFLRLRPDATVARIEAGQHAKLSGRLAPLLDGLRLAGLPET